MPRKKKDETPVVKEQPGTEVAIVVTVDQHPAELTPVVNEFRELVPHQKANLHLATFAPFFGDLQALEAEMNAVGDEDSNAAKELRLKYQKLRTGAKNAKDEGKKDILSEGRMIDGLYNTVAGACEIKESALKKIETARADRENEARAALKESRKKILDDLDYDTEFLTLEDMPDESFNRLVQKATEMKNGADLLAKQRKEQEEQAEANRLLAEQKQRIYDERVGLLMSVNGFPVGDVDFTLELQGMSEDEFNDYYAPLKEAHDNEAEHRQRVQARVEKLHRIGVFYVDANRAYESAIAGRLDVDIVEFGTDEIFNAAFAKLETAVNNDRAEKDRKANEEREAAQRLANRINVITGLGMVFVDRDGGMYEGFGAAIGKGEVEKLDAEVFKARYNSLKETVTKTKQEQAAEQKRKDDELADLQRKENERKAAELDKQREAEQAALAPDVDKLRKLYADIKSLNIPTMANSEFQAFILKEIGPALTEVCKSISKKARGYNG